ncbi:MAG: HisA/HisF-related TIM barrel protein, partial [Thermotogota bacterium]|nr:HisA/HisF-related TIM barrel protein [Thermotogota bacterium]
IPFMVGGGLSTVEEIVSVIKAGADKVFVNSAAVKNPRLTEKAASVIGSANLCVAIDAKWEAGGYEVYVNGGSEATGLDALVWAKEAQRLGAGEILITSMDADGVKQGFDIPLNRSLSEAVDLPVIASGGAGKTEDFLEVFSLTAVSGALAASVFHYGEIEIRSLKNYLIENGVSIRHERNG